MLLVRAGSNYFEYFELFLLINAEYFNAIFQEVHLNLEIQSLNIFWQVKNQYHSKYK